LRDVEAKPTLHHIHGPLKWNSRTPG